MEKSATVNRLNPSDIEQLRRLSTCLAASAIESFQVRLANTGFADSSVRCIFPDRPSIAEYAATARIRSARFPQQLKRLCCAGSV
jgi:4-hydroxy-4-methyl-2-oxoglutarate aldolase